MTRGRAGLFLSGRRLVLALAAIGLLAFVLPPVLAREIQVRRVARATTQVEQTVRALAQADLRHLAATPELSDIGVLSGPGDPPTGAQDHAWTSARTASLQSYVDLPPATVGPDPWLRALQVNIGAVRNGGRLYVLSAGPNGVIETSFLGPQPLTAGGDDVVAALP